MTSQSELKDKFIGTFIGLSLGDALGAPYEGGFIERFLWKFFSKTTTGKMRWTDDTQMSIDLAESILEKNKIVLPDKVITSETFEGKNIQKKSLDEIEKLVKDKQEMLAAIPSIQPIRNDDMTRIASGFGMRTDPFDKSRKMHQGLDFSAPRNTPIYAASNGTITRADSRSSGYGKHIRINHGYGYQTIYAHLDSYNVKRGQRVKKGDVIGYVGNTGRSKGFHLHYEVLKDGKRVNPVNYFYGNLTADEFDEILKIANQENQSLD